MELISDNSELAAEDITPRLLERIAEDTIDTYDCHQWQGIHSEGAAYIMVFRADRVAVFSSVARILALSKLEDPDEELDYLARQTCFNVACVNPEHAVLQETKEARRLRLGREKSDTFKKKQKRAGVCTEGHRGPDIFTPSGSCTLCNSVRAARLSKIAGWFGLSATQYKRTYSTANHVMTAAEEAYEAGGKSAAVSIVSAMGRKGRE